MLTLKEGKVLAACKGSIQLETCSPHHKSGRCRYEVLLCGVDGLHQDFRVEHSFHSALERFLGPENLLIGSQSLANVHHSYKSKRRSLID